MITIVRRAALLALTISLFLMAACSGAGMKEEKFTTWREQFLSAEYHEIGAQITASQNNTVSEFKLLYVREEETQSVKVLEPESLAGVTAKIKEGETALCYDSIVLETGGGAAQKLSPMTALPLLYSALADGHIERTWTEKGNDGELLVTELELPEGTIVTLYLSENGTRPVFAAIRAGDRVELKIIIEEIK